MRAQGSVLRELNTSWQVVIPDTARGPVSSNPHDLPLWAFTCFLYNKDLACVLTQEERLLAPPGWNQEKLHKQSTICRTPLATKSCPSPNLSYTKFKKFKRKKKKTILVPTTSDDISIRRHPTQTLSSPTDYPGCVFPRRPWFEIVSNYFLSL